MKRSRRFFVSGAAIVLVGTLAWSRPGGGDPRSLHLAPSTQSEGARLFVAYNCGDCHGAGGSGAMGPSLQDNRWRFGGSDEEIYRSIADGRPEGMPAWGPAIPRAHVLALVAYIQTLGAGKDLTTENFTGATVERTGH